MRLGSLLRVDVESYLARPVRLLAVRNRSCAVVFLQSVDGCPIKTSRERVRVCDDEYLAALRCRDDQPRKRLEHVGMQAGLRLVQRQERRRARRQQRREQKQESQRSVGTFGRLERPKQPGHLKAEREAAGLARQVQRGAVKRVRDGVVERYPISDLPDCHQSGGQLAPVMCECGRAYADLWLPRRSIGIRAEAW